MSQSQSTRKKFPAPMGAYKLASTPRISGVACLELDVKCSNTINVEISGKFPESAYKNPLSTLGGII